MLLSLSIGRPFLPSVAFVSFPFEARNTRQWVVVISLMLTVSVWICVEIYHLLTDDIHFDVIRLLVHQISIYARWTVVINSVCAYAFAKVHNGWRVMCVNCECSAPSSFVPQTIAWINQKQTWILRVSFVRSLWPVIFRFVKETYFAGFVCDVAVAVRYDVMSFGIRAFVASLTIIIRKPKAFGTRAFLAKCFVWMRWIGMYGAAEPFDLSSFWDNVRVLIQIEHLLRNALHIDLDSICWFRCNGNFIRMCCRAYII